MSANHLATGINDQPGKAELGTPAGLDEPAPDDGRLPVAVQRRQYVLIGCARLQRAIDE